MDSEYLQLFETLKNMTGISPENAVELIPYLSKVELKKGDYFVRSGKIATSIGYVGAGWLRSFYVDSKGREYTKCFSGKGSIFAPYASLLSGSPVPYDIEALDKTIVICLPFARLKSLSESNPLWEKVRRRIVEMNLVEREAREAQLLMQSAAERYENFLREFSDLRKKIPQYIVASYLGITPVALSRLNGRRVRKPKP